MFPKLSYKLTPKQLGDTPSGLKTANKEKPVAQAIGGGDVGGDDDDDLQARLDRLR